MIFPIFDYVRAWWKMSFFLLKIKEEIINNQSHPPKTLYISNSFSFLILTSKNSHFFCNAPHPRFMSLSHHDLYTICCILLYYLTKKKDNEFKYMLFYPMDYIGLKPHTKFYSLPSIFVEKSSCWCLRPVLCDGKWEGKRVWKEPQKSSAVISEWRPVFSFSFESSTSTIMGFSSWLHQVNYLSSKTMDLTKWSLELFNWGPRISGIWGKKNDGLYWKSSSGLNFFWGFRLIWKNVERVLWFEIMVAVPLYHFLPL